MSASAAGLSLLPVGVLAAVASPLTGRLVAARGPRLPLAIAGTALALGGIASMWLGSTTPLPAVLASYLLFGIYLGTAIAPITTTAVAGMPGSMAALASSVPSAARQVGTTLGVAVSGTIVAPALALGGTPFTSAERTVWWLVLALGVGILVLSIAAGSARPKRGALSSPGDH